MYTGLAGKQKADGQPHLAGALRQFADNETLKDVAQLAGMNPQMLRNKLVLDQPHQLSVHELVAISKASKNRCIVDGILLELDCTPSVSLAHLSNADQMPLTDRALEIITNAASLGSIAQDAKAQRRVTERMRHSAVNRATRVMHELAVFIHDVEQKFQAVPVLTVASDALHTMPIPGII